MKHVPLLFLFFAFLCLPVAPALTHAENTSVTLRKHHNLPHAGDSIIKQQVEFVDPGAAGKDITWDFRSVHSVDDAYNLCYKALSRDTSLFMGIEHHTIYRYKTKGDTLLHTGFENATTLMEYTQPEIKMKFPFSYGDTISSHFKGKGEYCHRMRLHVAGVSTTTADGTGILFTPDGREYKKVLRVKSLREYTETGADSVTMRLESYAWYVKGNRYPVFETVKTAMQKTGKDETEHKVASFFYPPVQQTEQTDTTGLTEKDDNPNAVAAIDRILTTCKLLPNPVESQLRIEYELSEDATVNFCLYDAVGVAQVITPPIARQAGDYTETIQMGGFSRGVYPFYVVVNGMVKTLHVVKQ